MTTHEDQNPLAGLHELGLLPLVKRVHFLPREIGMLPWVEPRVFDSYSRNMYHFSALSNVQVLVIGDLDLSRFTSGMEPYFGHLSPTLTSIALTFPRGSLRLLIDFLNLFQKLDNIKITHHYDTPETPGTPIADLTFMQRPMRGMLMLSQFIVEDWSEIVTPFVGVQFTSMGLRINVLGAQLLLDACVSSLRTLRLPWEQLTQLNLSRLEDLRSLEVQVPPILKGFSQNLSEALPTITSPVFSEVIFIFSEEEVRWPPLGLVEVICRLHKIREFHLSFCLETQDVVPKCFPALTRVIQEDIANGFYDFLRSPPAVFFRTPTGFDMLSISLEI